MQLYCTPVYTALNFWYGTDKTATRNKCICARPLYTVGPSTE